MRRPKEAPRAKTRAEGRTKSRTGSVLGTIVVAVLCVLMVSGSALFAFSHDPQKSLFGYRFYSVLTGSMTPGPNSPPGGFSAGDMIFVKLKDPATIGVGDIITYATDQGGEACLTHRVVDIKTEMDGQSGLWFITRGDTNNMDDPPVPANRVIGTKVLTIPMLGAILQQLRDNPIPFVIFFASALGLAFLLHAQLSKSKAKRKRSQPSASPDYNLPPCKAVNIDTTLSDGKVQARSI
jgi:signal peptidase I